MINSNNTSNAPLLLAANPWEKAKLTVGGVDWPWGKPISFFWGRKTEVIVEVDPGFAKELRLAMVKTGDYTPGVRPEEGWQPLVEGKCTWDFTPRQGESSKGTMLIFCREVKEVLEIPWWAVSLNMRDEVSYKLDGIELDPNHSITLYRGETHEVTCLPRDNSPLENSGVKVSFTNLPDDLIEDLNPEEGDSQPLVKVGARWMIMCCDKTNGRIGFNLSSDVVNNFSEPFVADIIEKTR